MEIISLYYIINNKTPCYKNKNEIKIKEIANIKKQGYSKYNINITDHIGTHIDLPQHFLDKTKELNQIFQTEQIKVLDVENTNMQIELDFEKDNNTEILILKTGWGKYRNTKKYIIDYPYLTEKTAKQITKNFPKLKFLGLDTISISNPNTNIGRNVHKILLKKVCIIEDINLNKVNKNTKFKEIIICPIFSECSATQAIILGIK